jgi:hypothetical protein
MTREEFLTAFHNQLTELLEIGAELRVIRDSHGLPSDALAFAETLLLCPTRPAAIEQMRRDQAAARSFLDIAAFQEKHITDIQTSDALTHLTGTTPFYVAASAVLEYLSFLKKTAPNQWK